MTDLRELPVTMLQGTSTTLGALTAGRASLLVNVASKCGLTPQYAALERLYTEYGPRGFTVIGFPCNQFRGQEPGSSAEIAQFCSSTYGVTFPMSVKVEVNGDGRDPIYAVLTVPGHPWCRRRRHVELRQVRAQSRRERRCPVLPEDGAGCSGAPARHRGRPAGLGRWRRRRWARWPVRTVNRPHDVSRDAACGSVLAASRPRDRCVPGVAGR